MKATVIQLHSMHIHIQKVYIYTEVYTNTEVYRERYAYTQR